MASRVNLLGHAVHPMLIVFPLGLLAFVPVFDISAMATGNHVFSQVAFWMLTCGALGGLVAAVPGFIDWLGIDRNTRAFRVGAVHLVVNVTGVALFVVSWILRITTNIARSGVAEFVLGLIGFLILLVGGWFGGELVERLGVGVDRRADYNAPPSLGGRVPVEPT